MCPKCQGSQFWRVTHKDGPAAARREVEHVVSTEIKDVGHFEVYICRGCGFSEWYAHGLERLNANPTIGVHLVDGPSQSGGPYR